ncbi:Tim44 domain-containing protein [Rhizobiaceae bacterium BDR2-2]|uniref:Tim44 domain-containing protein n=1 Tax=Ectorhizobium quercum TaxID=2965071 RepID=A0AAE3SWP8_9HYPH|nr:Tim44 domain-containing protein [Ectorhizobium quercum]MCX8998259.1 Tim44 domain-containing protein [Ectorhizobium quercum]
MPAFASRLARLTAIVALGLTTTLATIDTADARRAGGGFSSFGSRGSKTFAAPAPTNTAPGAASPVERSMTPRTTQPSQAAPNAAAQQRNTGGLFGGFGRSMLGGLLVGGLIGMLLGHGFGGMAGMLGMLLQVALIGGLIMLAMRFFASRNQPAQAAAGGPALRQASGFGGRDSSAGSGFRMPDLGGNAAPAAAAVPAARPLEIDGPDFDRFEELLTEVQEAYGREDYAALRRIATPEAMSYLAEELGENATAGVKNSVSAVKLLQGDLSEAWSEDDTDYATVALRYESIDVMTDRASGAVVEGNAETPTESTEIWTFARKRGGDWLLSAIQAVE